MAALIAEPRSCAIAAAQYTDQICLFVSLNKYSIVGLEQIISEYCSYSFHPYCIAIRALLLTAKAAELVGRVVS